MSAFTRVISRAIGAFAAVAFAAATASAQGTDTGSLRGRITDNSGAALPGVTVTAASDAVMGGSLVAVTSEEGLYRFPSLPPGVYTIRMELAGFAPAAIEGLRITVGLGLTLDRQLGIATVQETLTVVGESPIVDTRNTEAGATVTREILEMVPSSRDLWNTVQQVPGLVVPRENVGGFESTQLSAMSVHGSGASAVQHNVNGIDMTLDAPGQPGRRLHEHRRVRRSAGLHVGYFRGALARRPHHQPGRQERQQPVPRRGSATTTRTTPSWRRTWTTTCVRAGC